MCDKVTCHDHGHENILLMMMDGLIFLQDLTKYLQSKSLKDSKETLEHVISLLVDLTRVEPSAVEEIGTGETRFVLFTVRSSVLSNPLRT